MMLPTQKQQKQVYAYVSMIYRYRNICVHTWIGTSGFRQPVMLSPCPRPPHHGQRALETIRHIPPYSDLGLGNQKDHIQVKALLFQSSKAKLQELKYLERALQLHHSHNPFLCLSLIMRLGDMYREREVGPPNFIQHPLQSKTRILPQLSRQQLRFISQFIAVTCISQNALHDTILLNLTWLLNKIFWSNNSISFLF